MRLSLPVFFAFLAAAVTSTIAAPMPADSLQQFEARDIDTIVNYVRRSIDLDDSLSAVVKRSISDELDRRGESVDELLARMDDSELLVTRKEDTPDPADTPADPDSDQLEQTPEKVTPASGSEKHHGNRDRLHKAKKLIKSMVSRRLRPLGG